jgi:hypothetical protein
MLSPKRPDLSPYMLTIVFAMYAIVLALYTISFFL